MIELRAVDFQETIKTGTKVILMVMPQFCPPCHAATRILEEIEPSHPDKTFFKVNFYESKRLVESLKIESAPVLLIFKEGVEEERFVGFPEKKEAYINLIGKVP